MVDIDAEAEGGWHDGLSIFDIARSCLATPYRHCETSVAQWCFTSRCRARGSEEMRCLAERRALEPALLEVSGQSGRREVARISRPPARLSPPPLLHAAD